MTRIDFHTKVADQIAYTCRLIRKARLASPDSRIVILMKDKTQLDALDRALWTFSEHDFLPHAAADDSLASQSPVVLIDNEACVLPHHDILVNLSGALPAPFAQFERVCEIVSEDPGETAAGRERYAYYRERGYSLTHSVASQS